MTLIELAIFTVRARTGGGRRRPRLQVERAIRKVRRKRARSNGSVIRHMVERRSFRKPFPRTLTADLAANFVRNIWAYAIIFCGHFPAQTYTFTEDEVKDETQGGWYVRQLTGAANIDGGPLFHALPGGKPRAPGPSGALSDRHRAVRGGWARRCRTVRAAATPCHNSVKSAPAVYESAML